MLTRKCLPVLTTGYGWNWVSGVFDFFWLEFRIIVYMNLTCNDINYNNYEKSAKAVRWRYVW